ncbi:MAG: hypothetical protein U0575_07980 [Phycisphaerales bacterium]
MQSVSSAGTGRFRRRPSVAPARKPGAAAPAAQATPPATPPAAPAGAGAPSAAGAPTISGGPPGDAPSATAPSGPTLPKEELAELKATYLSLSKDERREMKAVYAGMGVDLDALFGKGFGEDDGAAAPGPKPSPLFEVVKTLDFARTPKAVLAARSQLGFGVTPRPDPRTAPPADLAKWLHLHVMAGEWDAFAEFMAERPRAEAESIYAHILQSMNKGDPGLLPEEVLAIADAAPGEMKEWQLQALAKLLESAAAKCSTGPLLAQIKSGTRLFGGQDPAKRKRAVDFLAGAGLVVEAYEYLPSLEEARGRGDAAVLVNHGRYNVELSTTLRGPEADRHRMAAWGLFCEAALLDAPFAVRQDAMRRAIDLLPHVPPAQATAWFAKLFANDALGPAALEIVALRAMTIRDAKLDVAQRAQTILTMKDAVDTLLSQPNVDVRTLRVPLRMLTTALVAEAEAAVKDKGRQRVIARETELLLRALPGDRWLDAIEPSLAARASKASIAIATIADKTDLALEMLVSGAKRTPDQATELADQFLQSWESRLNVTPNRDDEDGMYMFFGYRDQGSVAPVTRGRQRRNLERLKRLVAVLEQFGIEARQLPSVTQVFKACHARTEVFDRGDIERVFGPIEQMPAPAAAALADAMRASLSGEWRDREAQRAAGMNRTVSEIAGLVDKGYGIAIELVDRALAAEPDSWRFAINKASLAYDRMQFKQANQKQEFAKYDAYRQDAFEAFARAAAQYAKVVERGEERDDAGVYQRWFAAAITSSELNYLNRDDILADTARRDDQIDRIRAAILALPSDAADRHLSDFARAVEAQIGGAPPEVKPRLVRHALRIVGDHPSGASLRGLNELYQDLVKDEIKLRLTIDGPDRVGVGRTFGAMLSLRFTTAVDRETGGFAKYLQNDVYGRVGNTWRAMNYRDQLRKAIEEALRKDFDVESIGFFEALNPSRPVVENGDDGWQEKPMAYLLLRRKDPSVDRIPQIAMDMYFNDPMGAVTLSLPSNSPPLAVGAEAAPRPVRELAVSQIVDLRRLQAGDKDRAVTMEVQAKGRGVVPELSDLLDGLDDALPGYAIAPNGIEAKPVLVHQNDDASSARRYFMPAGGEPPKGGYPEADETGIYRLPIERSWMVTYLPTGSSVGAKFTLPVLKSGVGGGGVVADGAAVASSGMNAAGSAGGAGNVGNAPAMAAGSESRDATGAAGGSRANSAPVISSRSYADMDVVAVAGPTIRCSTSARPRGRASPVGARSSPSWPSARLDPRFIVGTGRRRSIHRRCTCPIASAAGRR